MRRQLLKLKKEDFLCVTRLDLKNPKGMNILSMLLGYTGIDRFLLGDIPLGTLKLAMFFSLRWGYWQGILAIIDTLFIKDRAKECNFNKVMDYICSN